MERGSVIASLNTVVAARWQDVVSRSRSVLLAGSGPNDQINQSWNVAWAKQGYQPMRLDIDPGNSPDIVASMVDMGDIGSYQVVYCCHALEHLYPHEVPRALKEFNRVLHPGGSVVIMVPDLEGVMPTEDILDIPESGPITGLHLFYGDASLIEQFPFMAHHCGFVKETLERALLAAGFGEVSVRRAAQHNLMATGKKL